MIKIILLIFCTVILFIVFVRYIESQSIFYPSREIEITPSDIGLTYEDVFFPASDNVMINGWFIKHPDASSTLIFFHGNAGNISHRLEKIKIFYELGLNVFIVDYRGYGKSHGKPTENGLYKDAVGAFDYIVSREDIDTEKIIVYGTSLGGVVAIDLAAHRLPSCLIVDSTFTSAADMCGTIYPFIPTFLLTTKMDSVSKVGSIKIPKLFIHSVDDEIIPFKVGKKLFDASAYPKEFLQIEGGHNTGYSDSKNLIIKKMHHFLEVLKLL